MFSRYVCASFNEQQNQQQQREYKQANKQINSKSSTHTHTKHCMFFDNIYFYIAAIPLVLVGLGYWKQNLLLYCNHTPKGSIGSYVYLPSRYNLLFEDIWLRTKDGVR